MAKITDEQAAEMYRLYTEQGYTYRKLAEEYDVSISTVVHAVSKYEKNHRWDDPTKAPLVCDQEAAPAVPQSVLDAVSDKIAAVEAKIELTVAGIKMKQRELEAMRTELAELQKWKEAQKC